MKKELINEKNNLDQLIYATGRQYQKIQIRSATMRKKK